jgi:hypothetical protein
MEHGSILRLTAGQPAYNCDSKRVSVPRNMNGHVVAVNDSLVGVRAEDNDIYFIDIDQLPREDEPPPPPKLPPNRIVNSWGRERLDVNLPHVPEAFRPRKHPRFYVFKRVVTTIAVLHLIASVSVILWAILFGGR